ncbi:hypothetical protein MHA_1291 [Mannheimia haemolytica PHL213]|nr:hypothetical protein MHA_1291 [Mannheimia haemolytica PHL213]
MPISFFFFYFIFYSEVKIYAIIMNFYSFLSKGNLSNIEIM